MRLLQFKESQEVEVVEHLGPSIPEYAILSHRWGLDSEEVTFEDFRGSRSIYKAKKGFKKIEQCGKQAAKNGLKYWWVDTCCIDKSSSSELSEAINSMWRWYRDAQICYAYLDDISGPILDLGQDLATSAWFTRGWTLQELLAPSVVLLYDKQWELIGTKSTAAVQISGITGIHKKYLCNDAAYIHHACIAERMSWASHRKTKREEDMAYCLLGIFNINMPLLYGEGKKAFQRLQEEIMKQSDDQSIFAWESHETSIPLESDLHSRSEAGFYRIERPTTILASSPADFAGCSNIVRSVGHTIMKPYSITNRGLQIDFALMERNGVFWARLNCRPRDDFFKDFAIPLHHRINSNQWCRSMRPKGVFDIQDWQSAPIEPMHINLTPQDFGIDSDLNDHTIIVRTLPEDFSISHVSPPYKWSPGSLIIESKAKQEYNLQTGAPPHVVEPRLLFINSEVRKCLLAVVIFAHLPKFTDRWILDARIVPEAKKAYFDTDRVYAKWKGRLSELPRAYLMSSGVAIVRGTPQQIRGRQFTMIDVLFEDTMWLTPLHIREQVYAFAQLRDHMLDSLRARLLGVQNSTSFRVSKVLLNCRRSLRIFLRNNRAGWELAFGIRTPLQFFSDYVRRDMKTFDIPRLFGIILTFEGICWFYYIVAIGRLVLKICFTLQLICAAISALQTLANVKVSFLRLYMLSVLISSAVFLSSLRVHSSFGLNLEVESVQRFSFSLAILSLSVFHVPMICIRLLSSSS